MAARPFSGKTKPAQSVQVTQFRWVVREISGYSYRCSVGSESFSVSGLCSGCQRRFVRQTDVVSLRNCTPYVRMNATSSISCSTVQDCHENAHGRSQPMLVVLGYDTSI